MNRKIKTIKVYDLKLKLKHEFKTLKEFEKFAGMKTRTAYYHWKRGEMILWDKSKTKMKWQVRFL